MWQTGVKQFKLSVSYQFKTWMRDGNACFALLAWLGLALPHSLARLLTGIIT